MPKLLSVKNQGEELFSIGVDGTVSFASRRKPRTNTNIVNKGNYVILVSYDTPVAAYSPDEDICYITEKKYSRTTTKHINQWVSELKDLVDTPKVPQEVIDHICLHGKVEEKLDQKDRFEDLIID